MSALTDTLVRLLTSKTSQMHRAVARKDAPHLDLLLSQGVSPDDMQKSGSKYIGDSPVHVAVANNDAACLRVLIKHGASVQSAGLARQPPLACWFDYQSQALKSCHRIEQLPKEALEVGALLFEHNAPLGSGGRASVFSGITPQKKIDANPELKRLQEYMKGACQADLRAMQIQEQTPQAKSSLPRPRF